jgi:hypothetical protein
MNYSDEEPPFEGNNSCKRCGNAMFNTGSYCDSCNRDILRQMYPISSGTAQTSQSYFSDMFRIIEQYTDWTKSGFITRDEYERVKIKVNNLLDLSLDERQRIYNVVQLTRYYFNYYIDKPGFSERQRQDASEFDIYYRLFNAKYYSRDLSNPQHGYGACYIASAVYGSYDAPQVLILRRFRDDHLYMRSWGRQFIRTYYRYSPHMVAKLCNDSIVTHSVKIILDQLVRAIRFRYKY